MRHVLEREVLSRYADTIVKGCLDFRRGEDLIIRADPAHREFTVGVTEAAYRPGAFEAFHNSQHRYQATAGSAPDETTLTQRREPLAIDELPAGWPASGRIEFIRFIRSDHKLRLPGRAIPMPDGHAYEYVTATLDLSIAAGQDNLLVSDEHGELITSTRLAGPRR